MIAQLDDFLADYSNQSIANFDLSGALNGMVGIIREHQIILPTKIGMLIKVLVMLEGTAQQLNPDFSLAELLGDYKQQAIRRRLSPAADVEQGCGRGRGIGMNWPNACRGMRSIFWIA